MPPGRSNLGRENRGLNLIGLIGPTETKELEPEGKTYGEAPESLAAQLPEWWKLAPLAAEQWQAIDALIAERDPYCRGVVLLGLSAGVEALSEGFRAAAASKTCKGFTVGRTIFHEPSRAWLAGEIADDALVAQVRATFETLIKAWRSARGDAGSNAARPHATRQEAA